MARKQTKKVFKLDYTTGLISVTASLLLVSLCITVVGIVQHSLRDKDDYKQPLRVTNLTYCNSEKLDLTVPPSDAPVPLIVYIHGGGWQYGSKVGGSLGLVSPLSERNFAVASINYRLSGRQPFPAQIQDVFCAVRYLRENAKFYNVDKNRVGVLGISAGANLAILAANASDQQQFTSGAYQGQPSNVQAAVGINGIYDLTDQNLSKTTKKNIQKLTRGSAGLQAQASPSTFVSAGDAKQLLIYGTSDTQVSNSQTHAYTELALKSGLSVKDLKVRNADHNLGPYLRFSTSPNRGQIVNDIADFFAKNL